MKKKRKLFVALVTVCALVMGSFAVPSAAAENVEPATTEEAAEQVTESTDVTVLREDESLRGEYEKHFLMSDGTYQVQVYSQPVHELVDGEWVEIQNTNQNARDSVGTDTTKSNIIDNYVLQGYGVQNKSLDRLYIGNRSAGLTRAYIQFAAMPTIPEGSTITGATMTLHFTSGTSTAANASAYQVTGGEWTSGTIQWSNKPAADVLLHGNIGHNNVTGYTINCLTAVQHWYDGDPTGQNENYGIMLRYYDETTADYNAVYSADYTDETKRPKLTIYYAPAEGIIPDGVYYIRSAYVGLYLGTSGSIAENTSVKLYSQASSGLAQLRQLWKVTYLGNYYYSIRPMHKLNMGLHVTSNSVDIVSIGTTDTLDGVVLANRWGIEQGTDGYYINYVNTGSVSMRPEVGAVTSGMNVVTAQSPSATTFEWVFEKVDNPPSGVLLYDITTDSVVTLPNKHITIAATKTLSEIGLAVNVYSGDALPGEQLSWSRESGTSCLTVSQTTGTVTGLSRGTSLITGTCDYGKVELYVTVTGVSSTDFTFINYYDSTFAEDPELIEYIDDAVSFVNQQYQRQFGVSFSSLTTPYYREKNIVDLCTMGNSKSCHSGNQCGTDCNSSHHKNVYRVSDSLYSVEIPQNHTIVFWTNHDPMTYCINGEETTSAAGVYDHRPVIHMMRIMDNPDYEYDETLMCMSFLLAHEFAHTLGLEHKDEPDDHEKDNSYECVMQTYRILRPELMYSFYEAVLNGDKTLFCDSCATKVREFITNTVS